MPGGQSASSPTPATGSVCASCALFPTANPPLAVGSSKTKTVTEPPPTEYLQCGRGEPSCLTQATCWPSTSLISTGVSSEQGLTAATFSETLSAAPVCAPCESFLPQAAAKTTDVTNMKIMILFI